MGLRAIQLACVLVLLSATSSHANEESVRDFLLSLYALYTDASSYDAMEYEDRLNVFSAEMRALMLADGELAGAHQEIGYLNGDPICSCQDGPIKSPRILSVSKMDDHQPNKIFFKAQIQFEAQASERDLALIIAQESGQWKVFDILEANGSLFQNLKDSIQERMLLYQTPLH